MNSSLYGKQIKVPQELISLLKEKQKLGAGKSKEELSQTQGWKRNLDLVKKGMLTFQNLERIQNWFKTNPKEGLSYELHGGKKMERWVIDTLQSMRKKDKKSFDIQKYTKPDTDLNPIVPNASDNTHQSHFKQFAPENINEEINRIKKLINYGSK
jgi:hypothetical protein